MDMIYVYLNGRYYWVLITRAIVEGNAGIWVDGTVVKFGGHYTKLVVLQ